MRKCEHGVYWPDDQATAESCQLCNPPILASEGPAEVPIFNRRGSQAFTATGELPSCPNCGDETAILTISRQGSCIVCGQQYEIVAPVNLRANNRQPGICPGCGSGIHYVNGNRWVCADCGEEYKAPKRIRE